MKIHPNQACRFVANGYDVLDGTNIKNGVLVRTIKSPAGTPPFGTMGHCYVADFETGEFLGLVDLKSLTRVSFKKDGTVVEAGK